MLEAELKWLRSCLAVPNGASAEVARDLYAGSQPWLSEYERQKSEAELMEPRSPTCIWYSPSWAEVSYVLPLTVATGFLAQRPIGAAVGQP